MKIIIAWRLLIISENLRKISTIAIIILSLAGLTAFAAPTLQNGDFSEPNLAGWTIVSDPVIDVCGVALFQQDLDDFSIALSQAFTFPAGARTLSFDIVMTSMGGEETDVFTAYLYDNSTDLNLLISNGSDVNEFFYIDNRYLDDPTDPNFMTTVGAFDGKTVTLDVSGFQGLDAFLLFNLCSEDEGMVTTVELDNVNISLIPAPGAFILAGIGFGCVTFLRKRRTL